MASGWFEAVVEGNWRLAIGWFGCGQLARGNDFIVTEYVDGGDLRSVLLKEKKAMKLQSPLLNVDAAIYPSQKRLQYALDIAEGMAFLHSKRLFIMTL